MIIAILLFSLTELIGRFHPVLVHLPIGMLLLAAIFQLISLKQKTVSLGPAINITLFGGMLSAIFSAVSGYLLSTTEDYDASLISTHQWFGIAVAVISIGAYILNKQQNKYTKWVIFLMAILIVITGHLGGSITHGSDYLTKVFSSDENISSNTKRKPISNVQEAVAYTEVIQPIFNSKCISCHGVNKQKGKLRLDLPDLIMKGGKDGVIIMAGKADESELIKRILLTKDNKDHMPPIEKPQLSKQEIELLYWWISTGANFTQKVKLLPQSEKIKPVLLALRSGEILEEIKQSDIPDKEVEKADGQAIQKLKARGISVSTVSQKSNYLTINYVAVDAITEKDLNLLEPLRKQIIWLKIGNTKLSDQQMEIISSLSSITRLSLERTSITDKGILTLQKLSSLQYINLVGTKVTAKGLAQLKDLNKLQKIFLYQTSITGNDWNELKKTFPKAMIDSGGYTMPLLEGDTSEVKPPTIIKK
jgi:mono/diheme cytochrome c family protein/uncharacterized membrane protein